MRCARCDAEIVRGALGGLCPVCLLDLALPDEGTEAAEGFHYDLLEEIARGGMGIVYRAVQHGSTRQVAVKMLLADQAATPGMMERFRAEAEAVASLDHPNILPIYEIGESDGRPFYSMKFASGGTLRDNAGEFWQPGAAARLIATIARAVHHAHQRGILHRDLKPGNILLEGAERVPYVSDFGIAKWLGRESRLTLASTALGTPHYMAPEQAQGASAELTTAADIYGLGAILYELLTGRPPFVAETALETLRLVVETPPLIPRSIDPRVPRDLEVICLKCLEKEPAARYSSAEALATDLERWLEGRTISARPATKTERLWRWAKRNPVPASLSIGLIALLLAAAIGSTIAAARIARSRDRAVAAENDATEKLYGSYLDQARASRSAGRRFDSLGVLEKAAKIHRARAVRDETIAALALVDFKPGRRWSRVPTLTGNVGFDSKLERYVIEERPGQLALRSVADDRELKQLRVPNKTAVGAVRAFSDNGRFFAAKLLDGITAIWDLDSGRVVFHAPQGNWTNGDVAFSPDNRIFAFSLPQRGVAFYRLDEIPPQGEIDPAQPWRSWKDAPVAQRLSFNHAGDSLAIVDVSDGARSGQREAIFQVREFESTKPRFEFRKPVGYTAVDWSPNDKLVAIGSWDHNVYLHDAQSGAVLHELKGHLGAITDVRFSHDGTLLASSAFDNTLRLWDVASGNFLAIGPGSDLPLRFSADNRHLGIGFDDAQVGILEIAASELFRVLHPPRNLDRAWTLAASADGRLLASSGDGGIQLWDVESGRALDVPLGDMARNERIATCFAPDGTLFASSRATGLFRWTLRRTDGDRLEIGQREALNFPVDNKSLLTDISADGQRFAVSYLDGDFVSLLSRDGSTPARVDLRGHPGAFQVAFSPDAKWVASGARIKGGVRVWNALTGEPVCDLERGEDALVAFSRDNRWLLTSTALGYQFWRVGTWEKGPRIEPENGQRLQNFAAAFSPANDFLAVQQNGDRIALHDARDATPFTTFEPPRPLLVAALRFTGDGARLAAIGANQVIHLWDLAAVRRELRARNLDWQ